MSRVKKMTELPVLPLPQKQQRRLVQAEVDLALYEAVHKEIGGQNKVKMRQVVEWGLKQYLIASNPDKAVALGILRDE